MSDVLSLALRAPLDRSLEADVIDPGRLATLDAGDVARLELWDGRERVALGDVFTIRGAPAPEVRLEGDLSRVDGIGTGMSTGELIIDGSVGRWAGARMSGGRIRVLGSAGDGAGLEMSGGVLEIDGNAGDRVGGSRLGAAKGMTGGEIVVRGSIGAEAGVRMRRGTIVCGTAGARAGQSMIAGNIYALGAFGADPGLDNKRGSLVVLGTVDVPLTYRYACTYRPPHLRLALGRLRRVYAVPIRSEHETGLYARYSGDVAELGKGEILRWSGA